MSTDSTFQPLKGYRVVDFSQVLAGPYATYQLGLLGAEIIKVENIESGDWTRPAPANAEFDGMGVGYMTQGANKRSIALNLKTPKGVEIINRLIATADVFVENFRPGTAARLGFGWDDVKSVNDRIVYCSISAYGQDGPLSKRAAYDHVVQGMCGVMTTTGTPETIPNKVGAPYVDYATGLNAAFAILSAILQAKVDGKPHRVDVSMLDSAMLLMSSLVCETATLGTDHGAYGNEAWSRSPSSGAFETTNGLLMIAANNERQFQQLCLAIDRQDILGDGRWADSITRGQHRDSLREQIEQTIARQSADFWEQKLEEYGVPAARVRSVREAVDSPQLEARGLIKMTQVPGIETPVGLPTLGFKADFNNVSPTSPPPRLGADTGAILKELGLQHKLDQLIADGIVRCD